VDERTAATGGEASSKELQRAVDDVSRGFGGAKQTRKSPRGGQQEWEMPKADERKGE